MKTKKLLTVQDVASQLGIGRTRTYQLISRGAIKSVKIGNLRRVPLADLEAYLQQLQQCNTSELKENEKGEHIDEAVRQERGIIWQQVRELEQQAAYQAAWLEKQVIQQPAAPAPRQPPQTLFPERLTLKEAAVYARVSVRTLNYERAEGRLHALKVGRKGRKVLLERKELDTWLKGQRE